jgi:hypothetical protein
MNIVFIINYFLVEDDVFVDNKTLLITDFVNLKIKSTQSFKYVHRSSMCMYVFIKISAHIYI